MTHSQYGVVPEDTDGFRALLSGGQAELHRDGFVQSVLQQLVVVVDRDADHRRVDDRTLWDPDDRWKEKQHVYRVNFRNTEPLIVVLFLMNDIKEHKS